jgi:hypothetical protein
MSKTEIKSQGDNYGLFGELINIATGHHAHEATVTHDDGSTDKGFGATRKEVVDNANANASKR